MSEKEEIYIAYINKYGRYKTNPDMKETTVAKYRKNTACHTWCVNDAYYRVYGFVNGKAGQENQYELPPPIDDTLFFGDILIVKTVSDTNDLNLKKVEIMNTIPKEEWYSVYEELFGGFEDIGSEESESEEDSEMDEYELTKEGYAKDGFVVD